MLCPDLASGDAPVAIDCDQRVVVWNAAVEELTGIPADRAIGRKCWEILDVLEPAGATVCSPNCAEARNAFGDAPASCPELLIKTRTGRRSTLVSTLLASRRMTDREEKRRRRAASRDGFESHASAAGKEWVAAGSRLEVPPRLGQLRGDRPERPSQLHVGPTEAGRRTRTRSMS